MTKRAVVMEPEEKRALGLLQQIQAVQRNKEAKRKDKQAERRAEKASAVISIEKVRQLTCFANRKRRCPKAMS